MAENGVVVDNFRVKKMATEVEHCHNLIVDLEMNLTDLKVAAVELAVKQGEEKVYRNDNLTLVVPDVEDKVDETERVAVVAAAASCNIPSPSPPSSGGGPGRDIKLEPGKFFSPPLFSKIFSFFIIFRVHLD